MFRSLQILIILLRRQSPLPRKSFSPTKGPIQTLVNVFRIN